MRPLEQAPDATVFFSTATLLLGVFLTVTAAALASYIPQRSDELVDAPDAKDARYRSFLRGTLIVLVLTNAVGTLLALTCLFLESIEPLAAAWAVVVLACTVIVTLANLLAVSAIYIAPALVRRRRNGRATPRQEQGGDSRVTSSRSSHAAEVPNSSTRPEKQSPRRTGISPMPICRRDLHAVDTWKKLGAISLVLIILRWLARKVCGVPCSL